MASINLPNDVLLPLDFKFSGEVEEDNKQLEKWLEELCRSIEEYFKKAYYDVSNGTSTFTVYTTEPTSSDLSEGQLAIYSNYLYTLKNNSLYRIEMTQVNGKNLSCEVTVTS